MVLLSVVRQVLKIALKYGGRAQRIGSGEAALLSRFPPNYRPYVKDIFTGTAIVQGGLLISDLLTTGEDSTQDASIPYEFSKKPYRKRQEYSGKRRQSAYSFRRSRTNRGYSRKHLHRCCC